MALADTTSSILERILSDAAQPVAEFQQSVEDSPAAELGPKTGVRPIAASEATGGYGNLSLIAKLGTRVFQRARERHAEELKLKKDKLNESYKTEQMQRLQDLTRIEAARFAETQKQNLRENTRKDAEAGQDPIIGWEEQTPNGPVKRTGKTSLYYHYLDELGRNSRAAAAQSLAVRLAQEKSKGGSGSKETLEATRYLSALPSNAELNTNAMAEAARQVDADWLAKTGKPWDTRNKFAMEQRDAQIKKLWPEVFLRSAVQQDSLRTAPLAKLRTAAAVDSASAAGADLIPKPLRDILENPE